MISVKKSNQQYLPSAPLFEDIQESPPPYDNEDIKNNNLELNNINKNYLPSAPLFEDIQESPPPYDNEDIKNNNLELNNINKNYLPSAPLFEDIQNNNIDLDLIKKKYSKYNITSLTLIDKLCLDYEHEYIQYLLSNVHIHNNSLGDVDVYRLIKKQFKTKNVILLDIFCNYAIKTFKKTFKKLSDKFEFQHLSLCSDSVEIIKYVCDNSIITPVQAVYWASGASSFDVFNYIAKRYNIKSEFYHYNNMLRMIKESNDYKDTVEKWCNAL